MPTESTTWSAAQVSAQYRAVAWLRWRIFLNNFRRKGSTGDLVARILIIPFAIVVIIGPTFGAGFGSWYFAHHNHLEHIAWILWAAFCFCQFLNIQLGQPGTTFDPTQLIRFPLRVSSYVSIRLFFGLLSPANFAALLISIAVAVGVGIASSNLFPIALLALLVFAATNILFSRMAFAWIDRWLSTRRAREIFTGFIFIISIGIQWLNFTFNPAYNHHGKGSVAKAADAAAAQQNLNHANNLYHYIESWLAPLPPNLTANALALAHNGRILLGLAAIFGCLLYAIVFYAIFSWRTHTEYRGENFSDQANAVTTTAPRSAAHATAFTGTLQQPTTTAGRSNLVSILLSKELLLIRRNTGLLYGVIFPIVFVLIFSIKFVARTHAPWAFPASVIYAMMGISPLCYNVFGLEGTGVQFYFMSPTSMRDVFVAKNIGSAILAAIDFVIVYGVICVSASVPSPHLTIASVLWAVATVLITMTIGNRRSISAAKKIEPGRSASKQASPLSGLISFLVLVISGGFGALLYFAEVWRGINWLMIPALAAYAIIAFFFYRSGLNTIDKFAFANREQLFAELCKQ